MSEYLFLYGTLLPHQAPTEVADIVRQLHRVGPASVRGRLYDLGEYPGAILDDSSDATISGEVFELLNNQALLPVLDSYEGFDPTNPEDSLFVRTQAVVKLSDGRELGCWVYVYNQDPGTAPLIKSGDYINSKAA